MDRFSKLFGGGKKFGDRRGKVESFETFLLKTSGMRLTSEYEIVMKNGKAEVSQYFIRYAQGKDERVLERRAVCDEERILDLFNGCFLLSWDGFRGEHPKGVLDGTMFRMEATVNGGRRIRADGSQNFPKGYRELDAGIDEILKDKAE